MSFPKVNPKQSFPKLEEEILAFWEKEKIFEKSLEKDSPQGEFKFFDGPPFATGLPHYGHILQGVIKDLIPRYKTMRGYHVNRVWGWDCHGLPIENLIEKELGLKSKQDVEKFGIDKFNEKCRESVLKYASEWKKVVARMGRWIDMENSYKTMDLEFMDSVWWVFGELWKKGLIYQGLKPMHICPRCATPLSNFEVGLGYKDVTDLSATAKFELEGEENTFLLAWTTTPWTLLGNVALAVNPKIDYVKVTYSSKKGGYENVILAKSIFDDKENPIHKNICWGAQKLGEFENPPSLPQSGETFKGKALVGKTYKPLFPYFEDKKSEGGPALRSSEGAKDGFRIVSGDFVTTEEGSGIVHIAPAFGEDDYAIAKKENLPIIQHVDIEGKFSNEVGEFKVMEVKPSKNPRETDEKIVKWLDEKGKLFSKENYKHSYPFCWRCETPLLNYATSSWFVKVEENKDALLRNNQKVNWIPSHIKDGRFGKWLENARDWAISRNRFWGAPLPIWKCEKCEETLCIASKKELEEKSGEKVDDLHKHFVDKIFWDCKCGGKMKRIEEVLDCWFESGSMPYAQFGEKSDAKLPADFIAEAQDQTRGWFYTLHVLANALKGKEAFSNCVCSGLVLAEDGEKMSKSKNNFPPPNKIFEEYGADAMRLYLMQSPVTHAEDLRFSEKGVEETLRSVLLPLWNTFYFFTTYANADGWEGGDLPKQPKNKLDRWILSELNILIKEMSEALEAYEIQKAVSPLAKFLDGLTNWYVRRSRRRFWRKAPSEIEGKSGDEDKNEAYATLFHVLVEVGKLLSPITPFLAEKIYKDLTSGESIHLESWSEVDESRIDKELSEEVEVTRKIISLGLAIRGKEKTKVRQPLQKVEVVLPKSIATSLIKNYSETIKEELNVKEIHVWEKAEELASPKVSVNARIVGKRLGGKVQELIKLAKKGEFEIVKEGVKVGDEILEGEEVEIGYEGKEGEAIESDGGIVVALDTKITKELELEGKARDLVRVIQELRKQANYEVSDRITLQIEGGEEILKNHEKYIAAETLAEKITTKIDAPDQEDSLGNIKVGVKK